MPAWQAPRDPSQAKERSRPYEDRIRIPTPPFAAYGQVLTGWRRPGPKSCARRSHGDRPHARRAAPPIAPKTRHLQELLATCGIFEAMQNRAVRRDAHASSGWCSGRNTKLNCLEYHRDSEVNAGHEDFILLLARRDEIEDGRLDTGKVKAFRVPAGALVEVYATTLHYAPCQTAKTGFPGAGGAARRAPTRQSRTFGPRADEDAWLWACNKWLLAHPDSAEAAQGAAAALVGENIDIAADI